MKQVLLMLLLYRFAEVFQATKNCDRANTMGKTAFAENPKLELLIKDSPLYPVFRILRLQHWILTGRTLPPPNIVKQRIVQVYARRHKLETLIETGTFRGDMIAASRRHFSRIISVEFSEDLCNEARKRFAKYMNIEIIRGDSAQVIHEILAKLQVPAIFWLDAHSMHTAGTARGEVETPILQEVEGILGHFIRRHVILIDDARFFNGTHDYPHLHTFKRFVHSIRDDIDFEVNDDIIRLVPFDQANT